LSKTFWPISGFYFFYFSILGVLVPYWGLYLKHLGFNAVQIGQLVAIISLTKIVSPMLWSWLSDRFGHTMRMVRLSSFVSFIFFCFVFVSNTYWAMAWSILAFSFFWNATLPQFEMNTFEHLGKREDSPFVIKQIIFMTYYPGATAEQVENQVTDIIEREIQSHPLVDFIKSESRPGFSYIKVDMYQWVPKERFEQIWDEMRRKVLNVQSKLPKEASTIIVNDDFIISPSLLKFIGKFIAIT